MGAHQRSQLRPRDRRYLFVRQARDADREFGIPDAAGTRRRLHEGRTAQVPQQAGRIDQRRQGVHAQDGIVLVVRIELRMDVLPVPAEQLPDQFQRCRQRRQALQHGLRPGQQHGHPQVPGALEQRERLGLHLAPIGFLRGHQRVSEVLFGLAAGGDFEFRERRIVVKALPAGRCLRKRQRH
jgi:hypothetical protein